jgi:putative ABC transport system permease protein
LQAYPTQAAVSLAAIVAAVSLMVAMAVMVTSFRNSLDDWLRGILPADLYLRAGGQGDSAYLSTTDQARLREVPGVDRVEFLRWQHVLLVAGEPRVTLLARDGVGRDAERRLPLVGAVAPAIEGVPRVWVSEAAAALFALEPGRRLAVPLGGQAVGFQVAGVWRDYARQNGALLIDRATYRQLTGDDLANDAGIWLAAGASVTDVRAALEALAPGGVELLTPGEVREISLTVFDRTFAVTYALEAAAILIGLMGLSSAIGAEVVARRKEFGMLRHLGVTQRQIAGMLAAEGGAIGAVGVLVGGLLGFAMSLILVFVVNRQSFHWGMDLHVPWAPLIAFAAAMVALAAGTAALGGRQALGGDVVRAVREDW